MIVDLVVIAVLGVATVACGAYAIAREVRRRKRKNDDLMDANAMTAMRRD